jgi:hypothetical protein
MSRSIRLGAYVAALMGAAGCASSGSGSGSGSSTTTTVGVTPATQQVTLSSGQNVRINTTTTTVALSENVPVGPDSAFKVLVKVYTELSVAATTLDSRQRVVGNPSLKVRRRLGGVTLVKYLDCGYKDGSPNAETYDIVLNLMSSVSGPTPTSATVSTRIEGLATHPVFGSQAVCTTTGELEKRIAQMVRERSAK